MATFTDTIKDSDLACDLITDESMLDQTENFYRLELANDREYLLAEFNRQQYLETAWNCPEYWLD